MLCVCVCVCVRACVCLCVGPEPPALELISKVVYSWSRARKLG